LLEALSKIIHKYKDNKKFAIEINNATYFDELLFSDDFMNNINKEPINGSRISDEIIGKFISL
tara:strand:- start:192 stop:380 length:189 start_codon:yes stop_codon:yes gene_type:complete